MSIMSTHSPGRRMVLLGSAAWIALAVTGCQSREGEPPVPDPELPPGPGGAAPQGETPRAHTMPQSRSAEGAPPTAGTASSGSTTGDIASTGKLSQASAQYQDTPKGDQKCSNCMQFVAASNTCKVVEGTVSPNGWCMVWVKQPA